MKYNPYVLTALVQLLDIATNPGKWSPADECAHILNLTNTERAKLGLQLLKMNSALNSVAEIKSQDMVKNHYFSHNSPIHGSSFDLMRSYGINYMIAGENLAINTHADNAHTAWMNSKAHKENILNPNFREMGIGIYAKENNSYAYTVLFIA